MFSEEGIVFMHDVHFLVHRRSFHFCIFGDSQASLCLVCLVIASFTPVLTCSHQLVKENEWMHPSAKNGEQLALVTGRVVGNRHLSVSGDLLN